MLNNKDIVATIAVKDLSAARKFYEDKLGLEPVSTEGTEAVTYRTGGTQVFVYKSTFAGTNKATAATWVVGDDVAEIAKSLKAKGVTFEHYDFPDSKLEGDVHVMGTMKAAWFKDPDGNILALMNGQPIESRVGNEVSGA
jgi:catechol 2,3-dioxygenase-like lactoylglutathione lyase family enzyme